MAAEERSNERRKYYRDVETLIDHGFLCHTVSFFNFPFVLRSFFPEEVREISIQALGGGVSAYKIWAVTKAIYNVKGVVFRDLQDEQDLFNLISNLPSQIIARLYLEVLGLMRKYQDALELVQAYSYEPYSRASWRTNNGIPPNLFNKRNGAQTLWQYFNIIADSSEERRIAWSNAKFIASAMSPKGVQKQQKKDESAQKKYESEKEEYIEKAIQRSQGLLFEENNPKPIFINAKTNEDLMDEYHRWVRGEKDPHDILVDQYKDNIRKRMEDREKEAERRRESLIQEGGSRGIFAATSVVGDQFDLANFKRGTRKLQDISPQKRLYSRFLGREEVGGEFYVDDNGQVRRKS